ncbi:MAG: aldose 1-epimerase family protein [Rhodospirillaceae bacterium]|nr:aldose 1-epimerase family protein [Rhodospirillaceae bacterium]
MPHLFGRDCTRAELARRFGSSSQVFGVRLATLGDGPERGVRVLTFRTGTGLGFEVMVDRGFDIGSVTYGGAAIGWHSPTGFRSPWLHEADSEQGLGWLRSFSGFMNTCGLDHVMGPASEPADHYNYPYRRTVEHGLHGRAAYIPARLVGYGERWDGDRCVLWCEGEVVQAAVFGENLHLTRRIEAEVGTSVITVSDRVENRGFRRTPHALNYHVNIGWPVVDEGTLFLAPVRRTVWTAHTPGATAVGPQVQAAPQRDFREQVYAYETAPGPDGLVPAALVNKALTLADGTRGLGFLLEFDPRQLPALWQWQNLQEGDYVVGIEPCTVFPGTREEQKARGEIRWLEHGQGCDYGLRFSVVAGHVGIEALARRIEAIGR